MNITGKNSKNSGYLVTLLLVVGLTAFSNSMRELAEIHRFTLDTTHQIAQFFVPAEIPQTQIPQVVVAKLESCESKKAVPSVEVEWLEDVEGITEPGAAVSLRAPQVAVQKVERRARIKPVETQFANLKKFRQFDFHGAPFEFRVSSDDDDESGSPISVQLPLTMFKAKNRKHNEIRRNPRDREMILKTLNRSINLRIAS
ncbi:MAG TPA: hypothetical protein VGQ41_12840 [Pyrinomonadaceae bacterium]|jgi:hypothetical protein|nr:hypothetical protein [Pyrinomonadaceae bacterium]